MQQNIKSKEHHRIRISYCGPGGWYCHCCGLAYKKRKVLVKREKKKAKRDFKRELKNDF